eukprot:g47934.t1
MLREANQQRKNGQTLLKNYFVRLSQGLEGQQYGLISRYAYAKPIKNKFSTTVLDALKKLPKPKAYISDNGGEFKGAVGEWMRNNGIEQFMVEVGDHNSLVVVEEVAWEEGAAAEVLLVARSSLNRTKRSECGKDLSTFAKMRLLSVKEVEI